MILRVILFLAGTGLLVYSIVSISQGKVHMKGRWSERKKEPGKFWFYILIYIGFSLLLLYFSIWGKIQR